MCRDSNTLMRAISYDIDHLHELTLPDDAVPCDATDEKNGWLVLEHQPLQLDPLPQQEVPHDANFDSFLKSQPEYISQYYEDVDFCVNPFDF